MTISRLLLSLFFLPSTLLLAEENIWKPETTLTLKSVSNIDVSPDGKQVVYCVTETKPETGYNCYITQLWKGEVNNQASHIQFTQDNCFSSGARWSPDGKWIAFISSRTGSYQLHIISPNGGEAFQITNIDQGVSSFKWSPDSTLIAFTSSKYIESETNEEETNISPEVDIFPSEHFTSHLYAAKAEPILQNYFQLSPDEYYIAVGSNYYDWSPDSKQIVFTYATDVSSYNKWKHCQIGIITSGSKEVIKLPEYAPLQGQPKFAPNGKHIAFLKSGPSSLFSNTNCLSVYTLASEELTELSKTPEESSAVSETALLGWSADSRSVLYVEPYKAKCALWNVPINGSRIKRIDSGKWTFSHPILSRNRRWLGIPMEQLHRPMEAYVTSSSKFNPQKVSQINESFNEWKVAKTKLVKWQSYDGTEIEGMLTYPKNYDPKNSYPFLLIIHGGPMASFDETYLGNSVLYPTAALADAGFVILKANPRGSCGYGKSFREANKEDWGGKDYEDLMSGVDTLIEQGLVDEDRMGVMGWSYGGYMTAWIITQTNRFAAASMGAGVSNLLSFSATTDAIDMISDYFGGESWEKQALYLERSPISYIHKVATPLLIQHGYHDVRVPFSQSVEFYKSLRKSNKPVVFTAYPRSGHTVIEPKLRLDCLQRNYDWFIEKVKNK
jgi:dipeptidyl aminopeptidase/acylaminoacyl peptidase